MTQIPFIDDSYIDEIIKSAEAYNPALNKTQGVKLRELIKKLRDRIEQNSEGVVHTSGDENITGSKTFSQISAAEFSLVKDGFASVLKNPLNQAQNYVYTLPKESGELALKGSLTKDDLGLGNVDNTSDADKPLSVAAQTALNSYQLKSEKATANGYASLDADGKVPNSQIPALAISETFVVASQAGMLAISGADQGDVAVRTDVSKSFILTTSPASTLSNWQELLVPTSTVASVNGQVGNVNLTTTEVTEGSNLYHTTARVNAIVDPKLAAGQTIGANISGNAANSGNWNTLPRTANGINDPGFIVTMNIAGDNAGYTNKAQMKSWLGETLQDITARGNETTFAIKAPIYRSGLAILQDGGSGAWDMSYGTGQIGSFTFYGGGTTGKFAVNSNGDGTFNGYVASTANVVTNVAGTFRENQIKTNGVLRWSLFGSSGAEVGSNNGTDFGIARYTDDGSYLGQPLNINRASGDWTIQGNVLSNSNFSLAKDASVSDPYAPISVTRGSDSNFAYYGMTRAGSSVGQIGLSTNNAMIFGSGNQVNNGTITNTYLSLDGTNAIFSGRVSSSLAPTLPVHLTNKTYVDTKAPLNGIGTSGTWPIAVTGNANTATMLQTPRNINGVAFSGANNITITDDTKLPKTGGDVAYLNASGMLTTTQSIQVISPTNGLVSYALLGTVGSTIKKGVIAVQVYSGNTQNGSVSIVLSDNQTTFKSVFLPTNKSGTLALTSDIPTGSLAQMGNVTSTFTVSMATQDDTAYKVNVTPTNSLSAAPFYITNKTKTTFDVVYLTGLTGIVTFDWSVFK